MTHSQPIEYPKISQFYPWMMRNELVRAASEHNFKRIDELTDELVHMGLARPRTDVSMFSSTLSRRLCHRRAEGPPP